MKRTPLAASVVALAFGMFGTAQAVPVYFDFTGQVTSTLDGSLRGTAISGGFTFETDRLYEVPNPENYWVDWQPTGLTEPLAFLNIAGRNIQIPQFADSYSILNYNDACRPDCPMGSLDSFTLQAYTSDPWSADYTGVRRSGSILVFNLYQNALPDYPYWQSFDGLDGGLVDPTSIATLPLSNLFGIYYESTEDCVAGTCIVSSSSQTGFSLETVSRGVGARSVPEPGTLALLAVALAGACVFRRKPAASARRIR